ncbi:class I SAM-dependent methyltransferase [Arvimicrobium flavum]|uniref:class I SAM-dependent methyltransferase n=1 Tax=Arvimicrobium flavum TaxID=3393320 RepID=UPI00237BD9D7|nr:class I SAM-dependent methyltransferase [Mesorhizobium shangrilense]
MKLTRLDKLRLRLEAQNACLGWAFEEIAGKPGLVFELGLGHGRTYDHLRTHLPERDIYVFDREIDCYEDCTPPRDRMLLGNIDETLQAAAERFPKAAALVHSDMGSYTEAHNSAMSALLSRALPAVLAPGAIVVSDLPLAMTGATALPLPTGAQEGRYFLYRAGV